MIRRILLLVVSLTSMTIAQSPSVRYTVSMSRPSSHLFEVELAVGGLTGNDPSIDFILPVWRPGRYLVLDFASGVENFSAVDAGGKPLRWRKVEKSLWRVETSGAREVSIRYTVYANEFSMRTRGLNEDHGFIDGAAVFMYVEKFRPLPLELTVKPFKGWHVTTGLDGDGRKFTAPNYDYLIDCPIEIGTQKDFPFEVDGVPHVLSIFGEGNWNSDTLIRDISKIVRTEKEFWGVYPYKRYVFLLHCGPNAGGGTEHINSTILGSSPFVFKNPNSYRGFLNLISHEYFHTWNVKQLRPKGIHPYDFTKENYSPELWIAEGTTSYYESIMLIRAGFLTADQYLDGAAASIQGDRQRPGNKVQSLADASFDAWVKYWRGTEQSYNYESDYYGKGANVSALLDLEIRNLSGNNRSLDEVMREMYRRFPLSGTGYTLSDFQNVSEEVAGSSLREFFDRYVYGTAPLPWEDALGYAGLHLSAKDTVRKPWLGINTSDAGSATRITQVISGSPAAEAGLDIGDELLALNGYRVRSSDIGDRISQFNDGDVVTLTVFRSDRLREYKVRISRVTVPSYKIDKAASPTPLQKSIYDGWLGAGREPAASPVPHAK